MSRRRKRNSRVSRGSSVRVTRTTGSGANRKTSYSSGGISITNMTPTGRVAASSRLVVGAVVRDAGTSLSRENIRLYLDGSQKTRIHYDPASGRLAFRVGGALSPGTHEVRVEADSRSSHGHGSFSGSASRRWTFTVAR